MTDASEAPPPRSLRDRPLGRILMLGLVLLVALFAGRSCANGAPDISKEEAIEIARGVGTFEPDAIQVRFLRQGAPRSFGIWAVSMYQGEAINPTRVQLVSVDAETGAVLDDGT